MKQYILAAGSQYYPRKGTRDWIASFDTYEEAMGVATAEVKVEVSEEVADSNGWEYPSYETRYIINGRKFDWYEIIDLSGWL